MKNVKDYITNSEGNAGIYVYNTYMPTKTSPSVSAIGTGRPTSYLRIETSLPALYVREDSIIEQIYRNNMTSIVMGEETWVKIYDKKYFKRSYTGLTVNGVSIKPLINDNLEKEMHNNDWDLMIGKFFYEGSLVHDDDLDNYAHTFEMNHKDTCKAIIDADNDIKFMIDRLDPDFLFITFGDHGAKRKGGHGEDSKEEVESGLFGYTSKGFTFREFKNPGKLPFHKQELLEMLDSTFDVDFLNRKELQQIDSSSTVAAIFNLPIPFSNQGIIMPELLHYECNIADCLYQLFMEHILNYVQVLNFAETYANKYGKMHDHKAFLNNTFHALKKEIMEIMSASKEVLKTEKNHAEGTKMNEQAKAQYITFVKKMFDTMRIIRKTLRDSASKFNEERYRFNKIHLYFGYTIQILATVSLILCFLLFSIDNKELSIFKKFAMKVYLNCILIILFLIILLMVLFVSIESAVYLFGLVLAICLLFIASLGKPCLDSKVLLRKYVKSISKNKLWISVTLSLIALLAIWIFLMILSSEYKLVLRIVFYSLTFANIIFFFIYRVKNSRLIIIFIAFIIFCVLYEFYNLTKYTFFFDNYMICSIIPTVLFLALGLYLIIRNLSHELHPFLRVIIIILFVLTTMGMMCYQLGEQYDSYKKSYFTYIFLPRFVFASSLVQILYLIVSIFIKNLLWKNLPSKEERIFAFFTLLLTSTVASLFILTGPNKQVYFLLMTLMCFGLNYMLNKMGLRNSFFFYTSYSFAMLFFYLISGHKLHNAYLNFDRGHVGFPKDNIVINWILVFFETAGTFSYMMTLLPLVTLMSQLEVSKKIVSFPVTVEVVRLPPAQNEAKDEKENSALETTIARNFLIVLISFEIMHNGVTSCLIAHSVILFTQTVSIVILIRSINWYICIISCAFIFILNKL
jgi:hypothetical protein